MKKNVWLIIFSVKNCIMVNLIVSLIYRDAVETDNTIAELVDGILTVIMPKKD